MKKNIVLAEDDLVCCNLILNSFKQFSSNINIVGVAENGEQTLALVSKYCPDFLLLDLNMPNKNGIEVLNELTKIQNCRTKVIIISGEVPMVNKLNLAKYDIIVNIFVKPFETSMLYSVIENYNFDEYEHIDNLINTILHKFNFNFSSASYGYLASSIKKYFLFPHSLNKIYNEIALEYNVSASNVKWGIEKLMLSMIRYTDKEVIKKYISYTHTPTPKVFIHEITNILRKQL